MRARAALVVVRDPGGRSVVRDLRSAAPLTLLPARGGDPGLATVRVVASAAGPLGGDDLELAVRVGPGARLALSGVAATLALPGPHGEPSRSAVRIELADGAELTYLPEPTVVTRRARHRAELVADLAGDAVLRCREVLVLGRADEPPGSLTSRSRIVRCGRTLLNQSLCVGDPELGASVAHLAGRRVLATEIVAGPGEPPPARGGDWWAVTPLAGGGALTTVLAGDAVTALRLLSAAAPANMTDSGGHSHRPGHFGAPGLPVPSNNSR